MKRVKRETESLPLVHSQFADLSNPTREGAAIDLKRKRDKTIKEKRRNARNEKG